MPQNLSIKKLEILPIFNDVSNKLEHVHLLMIEIKNLIFGFERIHMEHRTWWARPPIEQIQT